MHALNQSQDCELFKSLDCDVKLIDEAVRRLVDGTCCLIDEDKVSAYELFYQVRSAIESHIEVEDEIHHALLQRRETSQKIADRARIMSERHRHIETLLRCAHRELDDENGNAFRAALQVLVDVFHQHHDGLGVSSECNALPSEILPPKLLGTLKRRVQEDFLH